MHKSAKSSKSAKWAFSRKMGNLVARKSRSIDPKVRRDSRLAKTFRNSPICSQSKRGTFKTNRAERNRHVRRIAARSAPRLFPNFAGSRTFARTDQRCHFRPNRPIQGRGCPVTLQMAAKWPVQASDGSKWLFRGQAGPAREARAAAMLVSGDWGRGGEARRGLGWAGQAGLNQSRGCLRSLI